MKRILTIALLAAVAAIHAGAQTDIADFKNMTDQQIRAAFGTPEKKQVTDGSTNYCYKDFDLWISDKYHNVEYCETTGKRLCILPGTVNGGIKVGDRLTKLQGVNFARSRYGRNKQGNNLKAITNEEDRIKFRSGKANYVIFDEEFEKIYLCVENGTVKAWIYFKMGDVPYENYDFSNRLINK